MQHANISQYEGERSKSVPPSVGALSHRRKKNERIENKISKNTAKKNNHPQVDLTRELRIKYS